MTDTYAPRMPDLAPEIAAMRAEIRVRFGPGESQTMPLDWAEHILTELAGDKTRFGKMLTEAALAAR